MCALLASASALVPRASADLAAQRARGTLRVLTTPEEYKEWFAMQAQADPGFERELLEGFASLHRMKIEVVTVPSFDGIIQALVDGRGDVIWGIIDTPARRQKVAFTSEVLPSRHVAVSLRPQRAPKTLEELAQRRIGVVAGTTWADVAHEQAPAAAITTYDSEGEVLKALRADRVNATVVAFSEYLSLRRTLPALEAGLFVGARGSAAWAVRPGDVELRKALDEYLTLKKQSMGFSRLLVKYFGEEATALLGRVGSQ